MLVTNIALLWFSPGCVALSINSVSMTVRRRLFWLAVWSVAFGLIEAAVVVYLRQIYFPDGFDYPIIKTDTNLLIVEIIREITTIILIWAVAEFNYRTLRGKMAVYMIIFGIWDIFYYIFLKAFINWPESLAAWDILFLIPIPWVGPVWAPIVISIGLIYAGIISLVNHEKGNIIQISRQVWLFEILVGIIIISSFLIPGIVVLKGAVPSYFPWYLFWPAFLSGLGVFLYKTRKFTLRNQK